MVEDKLVIGKEAIGIMASGMMDIGMLVTLKVVYG